MAPRADAGVIHTIGHSNRPLAEFLQMLRGAEITRVVDIRKMRRSRANPQYNEEALRRALGKAGVTYDPLAALGGLRGKIVGFPPDLNGAWKNRSFHRYADHAQVPEFRAALDGLVARAGRERCALMCAEALWWRCHRRIVADHLLARDVPVIHILSALRSEPATLTPFAALGVDGLVTYPTPA